jgi:hypothetical protein
VELTLILPTSGGWGGGHPTAMAIPGSSNRQDMRLWTVESGFESLPRNFPHGKAPSSRGQGRCPLTAETRVRISVGPLIDLSTSMHSPSCFLASVHRVFIPIVDPVRCPGSSRPAGDEPAHWYTHALLLHRNFNSLVVHWDLTVHPVHTEDRRRPVGCV